MRLDSSNQGISLRVNRVVNYTITVPAWANVTLEATNGDIAVTGLTGELRVNTTNGRRSRSRRPCGLKASSFFHAGHG